MAARAASMSRVVRKLVLTCVAGLTLCLSLLCFGLWWDNRPTQRLDPHRLTVALRLGVSWLEADNDELLSDPNPTLWWMLAQADELLGGDAGLEALLVQYRAKWMRPGTALYRWLPMFERSAPTTGLDAGMYSLPAYNIHFLYGLTCDELLAQLAVVRAQNATDFCPELWVAEPHCRSHQLMGLLWALDRGCSGAREEVAVEIRKALWREEFIDPRVDDAFIQRALLLAFEPSGAAPLESVWVVRILSRQLPNGGWDLDDPALHIGGGRYFMLGQRGPSVRQRVASFHTTIQAVLLLARLLHDPPERGSSRLAQWASLKGGGSGGEAWDPR